MQKRGILYIATGDRFVSEVYTSARSVRTHMPELPITLYTDVPADRIPPDLFDDVSPIPGYALLSHPKEAKIAGLANAPYEETLFLDSDTFLCDRVDDIFGVLRSYDLAVSHDPNRYRTEDTAPGDVPRAFPEMNTGVMVFRANESRVQDVFSAWTTCYRNTAQHVDMRDQPSFRKVVYESAVDLFILPPEYNCRFLYPSYVTGPVKILHGRFEDMDLIAELVNRSHDRRILPALGRRSAINQLRVFYHLLKDFTYYLTSLIRSST